MPFQPPPALFETWSKRGVDEQGVRSALLACGFPNDYRADDTNITDNNYARGELCMLSKGFVRRGDRTFCELSPRVPVCQAAGYSQRPGSIKRPPAYEQWERASTDTEGVQQAMRACGYISVIEPTDDMLLNDIAAAELCMLDHGFHFTLPVYGLTCRNPPPLLACRGKVIDTLNCCAPLKAAGQR